jgi:4-diphosphocytidyl-2-C-methyl-D-erythritol kinase
MLSFPNCKINIGLNIINKREDGFHNLETIFYPVGSNDIIEVIQTFKKIETPVTFSQSGLLVDGDTNNNLCVKAYQLLKNDFTDLPPVKIHLHKVIPMGAGLGGGSADGAFMLLLLNKKFNLQLTKEKLIQFAERLGSDCPFFILNKPSFASSRGEILSEIELDLSGRYLLMIHPGIHVNTGWAFSQLDLSSDKHTDLKENIKKPLSHWKENILNDFEKPVFEKYPVLQEIKNKMYSLGAEFASMSGSGSTIYGIFIKPPSYPEEYFESFFTKIILL